MAPNTPPFEAAHELAVQLLHDAVGVLGAHDERHVEIVGRLRHQVDLILLEQLEHGGQLVQNRTDAPADERDGRAVADDRHAAESPEVGHERIQAGRVDAVGADVDGDRHVALGGGDQIDRQPVGPERCESLR